MFTVVNNSTTELATTLSPTYLNLKTDLDKESDETDSDPMSPRYVPTPVETPMSIAGTPFLLDSQYSTTSSSSEDVLVILISHGLHL